MTEAEKREQIAKQCEVVMAQAEALRVVHEDFARLVRSGAAFEIHDMIGSRAAALMEYLGDTLNGMDAVIADDEWMDDIFEKAHMLYPPPKTGDPALLVVALNKIRNDLHCGSGPNDIIPHIEDALHEYRAPVLESGQSGLAVAGQMSKPPYGLLE